MRSQQKPPGRNKRTIFIIGLALLLVISGLGFVLYSIFHQTGGTNQRIVISSYQLQTETANANLHASETSRANQNVTASSVAGDATNTAVVVASASAAAATATAISATQTAVSATKTAVAGATATSVVATATAYNGILMGGPNHQSDPLLSSNAGFHWDTVDISSGAGCTYTQGTYHAGDTQSGNFSACFEHQYNLTDFSCQVNMEILQGDNSTNASGYIGVVGQDVNNSTDVSFSDAQIWY
jgi:cytoskeletal protein RodZ